MEIKTLGELCDIVSGGTPSRSKAEFWNEGTIPWIKIGNIKGKYVNEADEFITQEGLARSSAKMLAKGTVLYTIFATLGEVGILEIDACTNQAIAGLTIKDTNQLSIDYLYYYLRSKKAYVNNVGRGVAQNNINMSILRNFELPLPELSKQIEIVEIIDKVSKIIEARQQELECLDDLIKARFVEMFGDPVENPKGYLVKTLQELIDMGYITYHLDGNHGGDYPRSEEFVDTGVPYISANCIVNGEIDFSKAKFLTPERAGKLRKGIAKDEDVLFAHNATVGPTVVLHTDEEKVILGTSLTAYRCNKDMILPNYLKTYMLSGGFVRQYSGEMKQTTRNQVPITVQKKYLFLIPSIEEQEQFANFVKQVDKSKVVVKKSLDETQQLFDSLMQKYFG
ncbi:MAG: restriction endonuclease subunit S [Lachnospiraceae bacterium]|nr:restriction endonuclease subunit S [Lachnospiraceae bacterium]